jgi:lactate dehydrogenase-like 2-hydroxyacid dehydrogenase
VQGGGTVTPTTLLDALPKLEIISVFGVGYDGVPVDYCRKRGLKVTNTPDVLTDDVADVALGLILMTGRTRRPRLRGASGEEGPRLTTARRRTAGILGPGASARHGQRLEAMGMKIAYTGRKAQPACTTGSCRPEGARGRIRFSDRRYRAGPQQSQNADVRRARARGRSSTIARGSTIDEPALVRRCRPARSGRLDVFADEPHVPKPLLAMDNVVLLPHVGSATNATRKAMGDLCKANLDAWFAGKPLLTLIPELA